MKSKTFFLCLTILAAVLASCSSIPEGSVLIKGSVKDNYGKPIEGAVVSDCVNCVKTNADGKYRIVSQKKKFVYVSTPGGYKSPCVDGHVEFYKNISGLDSLGSTIKVDFVLDKIEKDADNYKVIFVSDPQPRSKSKSYDKFAYHSLDICEDLIEDLKLYASTIDDDDYFTMTLGDLLHEDLSLYPLYYDALKRTGIPAYSMLGNHDHDRWNAENDEEASIPYESYFGPSYYSFNAGKLHYIVLDNIIMFPKRKEGRNYDYGLTEDQWTWLQNDLSFVDKSTTLIFAAHQPLFDMREGEFLIQDETLHMDDYTALLSQYAKVYCWAGHRHHTYNCIYDEPELANIEQHIGARSTGAFWINEWINEDGVPRGFIVMDVKSNDVSWIFHPGIYQKSEFIGKYKPDYKDRPWDFVDGVATMKSTGKVLDESYQMNVYAPGAYGDRKVYASIFMWDKKWDEPVLEINGEKRPMVMKMMYDKLGMDCHDFYYKNVEELIERSKGGGWYYEDYQNLWGCDVSDLPHGKGRVSVKDRFGNVFTSEEIQW